MLAQKANTAVASNRFRPACSTDSGIARASYPAEALPCRLLRCLIHRLAHTVQKLMTRGGPACWTDICKSALRRGKRRATEPCFKSVRLLPCCENPPTHAACRTPREEFQSARKVLSVFHLVSRVFVACNSRAPLLCPCQKCMPSPLCNTDAQCTHWGMWKWGGTFQLPRDASRPTMLPFWLPPEPSLRRA